MKNKRTLIYILIAAVLIVIGVSIQKSNLLQGRMFRFDDKQVLNTNKIDLEAVTEKTRFNSPLNESYLKELSTKNTLEKIWGARKINNTPSKIDNCNNLEPEGYLEDGSLKILKTFTLNNTEIIVISPQNISLKTPEIKGGLTLISEALNWVNQNIYEYPCIKIAILTHQNLSGGSPGLIENGGFGGVNNYNLAWHELIHSYFNSNTVEAVWLREGPSTALPTIMLEDLFDKIGWNDVDYPSIPDLEIDGIANQLTSLTTPGWAGYNAGGKVYLEKNSCDLNVSVNSGDQDYIDNSYWGRVFLLDLAKQFGTKTVIDTLNTVYAKYRYTDLEKIADKDFYDAFLYFVAKNNKTAVNQYDKAKSLLKEKLCL